MWKTGKTFGIRAGNCRLQKKASQALRADKNFGKNAFGTKKTVGRRKTEKAWTDRTKSGKNQAGIKRNL